MNFYKLNILLLFLFTLTYHSAYTKNNTAYTPTKKQQEIINNIDSILTGYDSRVIKFAILRFFADSDEFNKLHFDTRIKYLKKFFKYSDLEETDSLILKNNSRLALYLQKRGEYKTSLSIFKEILSHTSTEHLWSLHSNALKRIGYIHKRLNNNDLSLSYFNRLLNSSLKLEDINKEYEAHIELGDFFRKIGEEGESIPHYYRADEIAELQKDPVKLDRTKAKIGRTLYLAGEDSLAVVYFKKSLQYAKKNKDSTRILFMEESIATYSAEVPLSEKIRSNENLIAYLIKTGNKKNLSRIYGRLGKYYYRINNYPASRKHSKLSIKYGKEGRQQQMIVFGYYRLGLMNFNEGKLDSAIYYLKKAEEYNLPEERPENGIFLYETFADCYTAMGNYKLAGESLKKSLNFFKLSQDLETKKSLAIKFALYNAEKEKLKEIEIEKGKTEALISGRNYIVLSLLGILFTIAIALYFSNKLSKERKLNLAELNEKNKFIEEQRKELDDLNKMKDKIFSVIAHDLRGPVGNMMRLSKLMFFNSKESGTEKDIRISSLLTESSKSVNSLLQGLLLWGKVQMKSTRAVKSEYNFHNRIPGIINIYSDSIKEKKLIIKTEVEQSHSAFADEGMIDTVIRNIVHNSVKFADVDSTICITSESFDDKIKLSVRNKGVNIGEDLVNELINPERIDGKINKKGSGLGLILAKEFLELNDGNLDIQSEKETGTIVSFTLPVYYGNNT